MIAYARIASKMVSGRSRPLRGYRRRRSRRDDPGIGWSRHPEQALPTGGRTGLRAKALFVTASLVASLVVLAIASPAMATPKGEFAVFADCPLETPELNACLYATTESGSLTIGKRRCRSKKPRSCRRV